MRILITSILAATLVFAAGNQLGKPLTLKKQTAIATLSAKPAEFVGKAVQVKGKISEVCENMGCWMNLVDPETKTTVKIKVKDGEIVFPKDSVGKMAVAEGTFAKIEMSKDQAIEQAKHEAEEKKKKFDPASVTGPVTIYQIQGTGAVID
ncbi:MAG: DUF4920 domain-containing protein [Acidobacteria bacterium]|nr:DUF4920 domain-containing protein [Acidobacteriota bacterium]